MEKCAARPGSAGLCACARTAAHAPCLARQGSSLPCTAELTACELTGRRLWSTDGPPEVEGRGVRPPRAQAWRTGPTWRRTLSSAVRVSNTYLISRGSAGCMSHLNGHAAPGPASLAPSLPSPGLSPCRHSALHRTHGPQALQSHHGLAGPQGEALPSSCDTRLRHRAAERSTSKHGARCAAPRPPSPRPSTPHRRPRPPSPTRPRATTPSASTPSGMVL